MKLYKSKELAQDLIAGSECETQAVLYTSWGSLGFLGVPWGSDTSFIPVVSKQYL
jgi:hypothetical protein